MGHGSAQSIPGNCQGKESAFQVRLPWRLDGLEDEFLCQAIEPPLKAIPPAKGLSLNFWDSVPPSHPGLKGW